MMLTETQRERARIEAAKRVRDAMHQFARNGRWGTCGGCPRTTDGATFPEFCARTARTDHHIDIQSIARLFSVELREAEARIAKEAP